MKVQLVVVQGKPEGMVIPLATPKYKIGRGEACQLRPNSDLVSREHAEFVLGADSVLVQDLGSRNGTEVNGKRLTPNQPQPLRSGDLIKVGTLTFAISIEGVPAGKASVILSGGGRKPSLDDVSGDEIDAWLVSDETRPTPDRPSGVYGGDTITLATFQGQEKAKAPEPPKPVTTPAARPIAPAPAPAAPAPVAKAPEPTPPLPAPVAKAPEPAPTPPPPVAPRPPAPVAEEPAMNPLFNFEPDPTDEAQPEVDAESFEELVEDDGIEDLAALQAADSAGDDATDALADEFVDESNPFYVKKKADEGPADKPNPTSGDSSTAAGDILRKLLDRRRASK